MKTDEPTFNDFLVQVTALGYKNKLRYGQNFWNLLLDIRPDIAKEIHGTELDPFYLENVADANAERMNNICRYVESAW